MDSIGDFIGRKNHKIQQSQRYWRVDGIREFNEYNIVFDTDFFGNKRPTGNVTPGPFEVMGEEPSACKFEL